MFNISRRNLLAGSAALLGGSMIRPAFAQQADLRMIFWGSQNRADRTYKVLDAFADKTGVPITGEFLAFGDYWPKVATQTAAGQAPDVLQMDGAGRYVTEYANRGAILPLDEFIGDVLDFSDFDEDQLDAGRFNGSLYAVSLGANAAGMIVNTELFEKAGVDVPGASTTYDDYWSILEAFRSAGLDMAVLSDDSGSWSGLENWLRQNGKELYTADGALGFDEADMAGWLELWSRMRRDGVCVSADLQALSNSPATSGLTAGRSAATAEFSNLLVAFQELNPAKLVLTNLPRVSLDKPGGHYRRPSMFFSISANTIDKANAARFINYFVNDIEANKILNAERGIPCSASVRAAIADTLTQAGRAAVEYVGGLGPLLSLPPAQSPSGAGEINETLLLSTSQEVAFEVKTPEQAGEDFVAAAREILNRAA